MTYEQIGTTIRHNNLFHDKDDKNNSKING